MAVQEPSPDYRVREQTLVDAIVGNNSRQIILRPVDRPRVESVSKRSTGSFAEYRGQHIKFEKLTLYAISRLVIE